MVRFKAGLISSLISYRVNQFSRQNRSQYEECWDKGNAQYSGDNVVAGGRKMARREGGKIHANGMDQPSLSHRFSG